MENGRGRFAADPGAWVRTPAEAPAQRRAAIFLDRDGVIIEDPGYLCRAADVRMIPGAAEFIALANRSGVPVIEVTNQSGIGRGYYGWDEFLEVEDAVARELAPARIDGMFACPYHRDGIPQWAHPEHPARKPRPGMLLAAQRLMNLDLSRSWIAGDKSGDLLAGRNAGLRGGFHVFTGRGARYREAALGLATPAFEVLCGASIADAIGAFERMFSCETAR